MPPLAARLLAMSFSAAALAGCDGFGSPLQPTAPSSAYVSSITISLAGPSPAAAIAWHCIASTPDWGPPADCAAVASRARRVGSDTSALAAPASPTNLTASISGSRVTLVWNGPIGGDPPSSYVVEAGSTTGGIDLANFDTGSTSSTLTADQVPVGTYFVRVRAKNNAGLSASSNEVIVTVGGGVPVPCASAPSPPAGRLGWSTAVPSTMQISWNAAGGVVTSYIVEVGSFQGGSDLAIVDTGSTALSYTFIGVPPGTYYVRVRAKNPCGTSGPSLEAFPRVFASNTPVQVDGTWNAVGTVSGVTSSDCIGPVFADLLEGASEDFRLVMRQSGTTLTATSTHDDGISCSWTGTASTNTVTLQTSSCNLPALRNVPCTSGARRDIQFASRTINVTVNGNAAPGTEVQTYHVFAAGTPSTVGTLFVNATLSMNR